MDISQLVFLDTETTSLRLDGEIWELAFDIDGQEDSYLFEPQRWDTADPMSLKVGRFYERTKDLEHRDWSDPERIAPMVAKKLDGRHIVGACPNFDENFLRDWFRKNGAVLTTHYHLLDIENLIVGWLIARRQKVDEELFSLPWKSDELSRAVGVDPDEFERHTALGDVRWVKKQFEAITK